MPEFLIPHRYDVRRWVDDPVDLAGQRLEGLLFLGVIGMAVVSAPYPADDVPKAALGMVGRNTCPAHQGPRCPAQVVQGPAGYAATCIKTLFEFRETGYGLFTCRKNIRNACNTLNRRHTITRRLRQRDDMIQLGLVTRGRNDPVIARQFASDISAASLRRVAVSRMYRTK